MNKQQSRRMNDIKTPHRYCKCCGDRYKPFGVANNVICHACAEIAIDITRVCGEEFVSIKSVLYARNRERLAPLFRGSAAPIDCSPKT